MACKRRNKNSRRNYPFLLASISRLLSDGLTDDENCCKITKAAVATYLLLGATCGLIVALILHATYGATYFLVGVAGIAGFGAVPLLSTMALALNAVATSIISRLKPKND